MPELPEVEHLRRALERSVSNRRVTRATLARRDVVARPSDPPGGFSRAKFAPTSRVPRAELLQGATIDALLRHGKQLAITTHEGPTLCIHLGMSGRLTRLEPGATNPHPDHVHAHWTLDDGARLIFRDPRRFGGIWTFPSPEALHASRWSTLGPDALTITAASLARLLARANRPVKAALLDQSLIAGLGNIYADEALFSARINPATNARALDRDDARRLASAIRATLRKAVSHGGSTLRDYRDADGNPGAFQRSHRVYARAGLPCTTCNESLCSDTIAQRTTVWCPVCQPLLPPHPIHTPAEGG